MKRQLICNESGRVIVVDVPRGPLCGEVYSEKEEPAFCQYYRTNGKESLYRCVFFCEKFTDELEVEKTDKCLEFFGEVE